MILVAGEALIDLILHEDGRLEAVPGGGPFNTARTIGRLGGDVAFLGRLSTDRFGSMLCAGLVKDGVDLRWATSTDLPTTLAVAEIDASGSATYRFHLVDTSAPGLEAADVSVALGAGPRALHLGSLGLVVEPIASALVEGLERLDPDTLVMLDPNCRPRLITDRPTYLTRLQAVIARSDVVKVSAVDMAYLRPDLEPEAAARAALESGPSLVLLTDGGGAVHAVGRGFTARIPVPAVAVVDTVGAGDAFGGGFLAAWMERGLGRAALADEALVRAGIDVAIDVAGLTCGRPGADPPRRAEVTRLAS